MARKASTKPESGSSSTATIGFEALTSGQPSGARQIAKGNPQGERGRVYHFYIQYCVVPCLVEMLASYKGRIYDPACGSGGSLPASRLCSVHFADKDRAISQGIVQTQKIVESQCGTGQRDIASSKSEATLPCLHGPSAERHSCSRTQQTAGSTSCSQWL